MGTCQSRSVSEVDGHSKLPGTSVAKNASAKPSMLQFTKSRSNVAILVSPSSGTAMTTPESPAYQSVSPGSHFNFVSPMPPSAQSPSEYNKEVSKLTRFMNEVHPFAQPAPSQGALSSSLSNKRTRTEEPRLQTLSRQMASPVSRGPTYPEPMEDDDDESEGTSQLVIEGFTSVAPNTVANFNRLKTQLEVAKRNELHERKKAKIEDRFKDVKCYRSLWGDYEKIKAEVSSQKEESKSKDDSSRSSAAMDLKSPDSWFFDFAALKMQRHLDMEEGNDTQSVGSMTLLSASDVQSQKEYFKNKRIERQRKRNRSRGLSGGSSVASTRRTVTVRPTGLQPGDYGPSSTPIQEISYIEKESNTPRMRTAADGSDAYSVVSDLGFDNDYNVARRQNQVYQEHGGDENSTVFSNVAASSVGFDTTSFEPRIRCEPDISKAADVRPRETYGFNPNAPLSTQFDDFIQSVPVVKIDEENAGVVRWREFPSGESTRPKTARQLDGLFGEDDESNDKKTPIFGQPSMDHDTTINSTSRLHDPEMQGPENDSQGFQKGPAPEKSALHVVSTSAAKTPRQSRTPETSNVFEPALSGSYISGLSTEAFLQMSTWHSPEPFKSVTSVEEVEQRQPTSPSTNIPFQKSTLDPVAVSSMSTDAFLQLSSGPMPPVSFESLDWYETSVSDKAEPVREQNPKNSNNVPVADLSTEAFLQMSVLHSMNELSSGSLSKADTSSEAQDDPQGVATASLPVDVDVDAVARLSTEAFLGMSQWHGTPWNGGRVGLDDDEDFDPMSPTEKMAAKLENDVQNLLRKFRSEQ
eukprot:Nitzschia sp. Nitz4//scaffold8_size234185//146344//148785//NITZ4_001272-RA/size234185-snap-gene-0.19-mRNA-1//1//CDS//3329559851//1210//frame0